MNVELLSTHSFLHQQAPSPLRPCEAARVPSGPVQKPETFPRIRLYKLRARKDQYTPRFGGGGRNMSLTACIHTSDVKLPLSQRRLRMFLRASLAKPMAAPTLHHSLDRTVPETTFAFEFEFEFGRWDDHRQRSDAGDRRRDNSEDRLANKVSIGWPGGRLCDPSGGGEFTKPVLNGLVLGHELRAILDVAILLSRSCLLPAMMGVSWSCIEKSEVTREIETPVLC